MAVAFWNQNIIHHLRRRRVSKLSPNHPSSLLLTGLSSFSQLKLARPPAARGPRMQWRCGVKTSTTSGLTRAQREMSKCVDLNSARLLRKLWMPRAKREASQCVRRGEIKRNTDCMSFYHLSFFSLSIPALHLRSGGTEARRGGGEAAAAVFLCFHQLALAPQQSYPKASDQTRLLGRLHHSPSDQQTGPVPVPLPTKWQYLRVISSTCVLKALSWTSFLVLKMIYLYIHIYFNSLDCCIPLLHNNSTLCTKKETLNLILPWYYTLNHLFTTVGRIHVICCNSWLVTTLQLHIPNTRWHHSHYNVSSICLLLSYLHWQSFSVNVWNFASIKADII